MIKVAIVRGSYLNQYEGQNFSFIKNVEITGVSSLYPLHDRFPFPVIKLSSLADLQKIWWLNRPIKIITNRLIGDSQILFGLEKLARKFDIFHCADPHYYYSYQLARLRKENKIKRLVITSWETIPFNNEKIWAKKRIKYFTLNQGDLFVTYTNIAKQALIKEGIKESKIKVLRIGVDLERFVPSKRNSPQLLTILFVGRLVEEKGVFDLFDAYLNLKKNGFGNLKLVYIGEGNLRKSLERKIKKFNLTKEVIIKSSSYQKIPFEYQKADLFVLPSKRINNWEEQYGMVLVEAMASGLPVIASRSGAIPEILADNGIYFSEGKVDDLTKRLITVIKKPQLRERLGKMGIRRVQKYFNAQEIAKKFEEIYYQLVKKDE